MTMGFSEWSASVVGKRVGPNDTNGQCVGLYYDYMTNCLGIEPVSTNYGPHGGYAIGTWDSGKPPAGLVAIKGAGDIRKGDIVFWNWGTFPTAPLSHVAVANGPSVATVAPFVTQNSPLPVTTIQPLSVIGVAGVWRPANSTEKGSPDPTGLPQIGDGIGGVQESIAGLGTFLSTIAGTNPNVPNLWPRVGIFVLGAILIWIALASIIADSAVGAAGISTLKKVVKK